MATIVLPAALRLRQSPEPPSEFEVEADTLADALEALIAAHPGVREAIFEPGGATRTDLRIFIDEEPVETGAGLDFPLRPRSEILLLVPIAGG
jgi:molybdopterin converting factor small subunit